MHGTSYLFISFSVIVVGFVMSIVFLPVFHDLKLTSTYEYLEKRFDKKMRLLGSILFAINIVSKSSRKRTARINFVFSNSLSWMIQIYSIFFQMTWLPIVIYVPALAFNQGTSFSKFNKKSKLIKLEINWLAKCVA